MKRTRSAVAALLLAVLASVSARAETLQAALLAVERDLDARVGFFMRDLQSGETVAFAADERFPLNSTFKLFACAALLARVDEGHSTLDEPVDLRGATLVSWSPGVRDILDAGRGSAALDELCAAMLAVSDNTAANLVLQHIGGPAGFTAFMRLIGDEVTRLDRWETALNEGLPGDPRDTTTPRAIARSLETLLLGTVLTPASRETLGGWLAGHSVADALFRAELPPTWSIEDRTGAGEHGTRSIVAVLYPPGRRPIVTATYLRDADVSLAERNAAMARIGRAIVLRTPVP